MPDKPKPPRLGPRGGRWSVTAGGLRKASVYLTEDELAALKRAAWEQDRPQSFIARRAICRDLGLPEPDPYE